jgi:hypothetical protein
MSPTTEAQGLRRREALAGAAASGLGLLWSASRHGWVEPARAAAVAERAGASCTLSRELTDYERGSWMAARKRRKGGYIGRMTLGVER